MPKKNIGSGMSENNNICEQEFILQDFSSDSETDSDVDFGCTYSFMRIKNVFYINIRLL